MLKHVHGPQLFRSSLEPNHTKNISFLKTKWKGDNLCMDNVVDYFSSFGKCEPMDWSSAGGQNTVPLAFQDDQAVVAIRSRLTYAVKDDRGRVITVSVV